MTTSPAIPADDCTLEGPCGFCATLTPAVRAALAKALAAEESPTHGSELPARAANLLRWDDELSVQASRLEGEINVLAAANVNDEWWLAARRDYVAIEIAKTVGLIVAAPADVHIIRAGIALNAARKALAEALPQS